MKMKPRKAGIKSCCEALHFGLLNYRITGMTEVNAVFCTGCILPISLLRPVGRNPRATAIAVRRGSN
jgi:hypothetical protein